MNDDTKPQQHEGECAPKRKLSYQELADYFQGATERAKRLASMDGAEREAEVAKLAREMDEVIKGAPDDFLEESVLIMEAELKRRDAESSFSA